MTGAQGEENGVVEVRNMDLSYGDFVLIRDINFSVRRGDVFIIMGMSGSGKSTLLKQMVGLKRPSSGEVLFGGVDYWGSDAARQEELKRRFGILFQTGALWSSMTLAENIALPLEQYTSLSTRQIRDQVAFKLALVGLGGFGEFYPAQLSGGMRKRAGLARALALDPDILFFDEPSSGLDPVTARLLDDLIVELRESIGTTLVVVTHDLASIFTIGTDSIFLDPEAKKVTASGDPKRLLRETSDPAVITFLTRGEKRSRQ